MAPPNLCRCGRGTSITFLSGIDLGKVTHPLIKRMKEKTGEYNIQLRPLD